MIASADFVDPDLQLPVVSLYGPRMTPPAEALAEVDAVLVDMQDVGTRVYTFAATLAKVMAAAAPLGKKVVVLDRPNPIGGTAVEGNLLRPEWASFVGPYPLPMRHGFTLGELARYYRVTQKIDCDLEVIPLQGWRRGAYFDATGLPWVLPSPNLPTLEGCLVYPGQVLLEGTNLSEGRGTTRPFELFGAPFLEPRRIKAILPELPGVILREAHFEPTFHKWAGEMCRGFQLHVTDREQLQTLLHHPGPAGGDPGIVPGAVRLAPAALRIRDRAAAHRPAHRGRGDSPGPGAGPKRGGVGSRLAGGLNGIYGSAAGVSAVSGVKIGGAGVRAGRSMAGGDGRPTLFDATAINYSGAWPPHIGGHGPPYSSAGLT